MPRCFNPPFLILCCALIVYSALSLSIAAVKTPWVDEGWIASAPANWAATGHFGSPSIEPTGTWLDAELKGIREYTYWNLPVGLVLQGVWYRLVGFSILKMRMLGILAGMLAIISWFQIVRCLAASPYAAAMTATLLSIDFTFLWSAADGRMDMLCVAFGSAAFATYLSLRERYLKKALYFANALLALSLFTHPNGILYILAVGIAFLYFDRARFSWKFLPALLLFVVIAALWGVYISRRPDYFSAQFSANASAMGGSRWQGLMEPWQAVLEEAGRYLGHYGFFPIWIGKVPHYVASIPLIFWAVLVACTALRFVRARAHVILLVAFTWIALLFMIFFTIKTHNYLVYILPGYIALFSIWTVAAHTHRRAWAPLTALLAGWLIFCNASVANSKIAENAFAHEYLPAVQYLKLNLKPGGSVFGTSALGLQFGFKAIDDDCRLGFYTGRSADYVVEDLFYSQWWSLIFKSREPAVYRFVRDQLQSTYSLAFISGNFKIYRRNVERTPVAEAPPSTLLRWFSFDGKLSREITLSGIFVQPAFDSDDKGLYLGKLRPGSSQLCYFNLATQRITTLLSSSDRATTPICADNINLCAVSLRRQNRAQIFSYSSQDGPLDRLLRSDSADLPNAWSADGKWLAFTRCSTPASQIWLYSVQQRLATLLFTSDRAISELQFSPDQKHAVFTSAQPDGSDEQVYTADWGQKLCNLKRISLSGGHSGSWLNDQDVVYIQRDQTLTTKSRIHLSRALGYALDRQHQELVVASEQ